MAQSLSSGFNKSRHAAKSALNMSSRITGKADSTLSMYEKLRPAQFDIIAQVYGQDGLLRYIKTMEAKKMKGK